MNLMKMHTHRTNWILFYGVSELRGEIFAGGRQEYGGGGGYGGGGYGGGNSYGGWLTVFVCCCVWHYFLLLLLLIKFQALVLMLPQNIFRSLKGNLNFFLSAYPLDHAGLLTLDHQSFSLTFCLFRNFKRI